MGDQTAITDEHTTLEASATTLYYFSLDKCYLIGVNYQQKNEKNKDMQGSPHLSLTILGKGFACNTD